MTSAPAHRYSRCSCSTEKSTTGRPWPNNLHFTNIFKCISLRINVLFWLRFQWRVFVEVQLTVEYINIVSDNGLGSDSIYISSYQNRYSHVKETVSMHQTTGLFKCADLQPACFTYNDILKMSVWTSGIFCWRIFKPSWKRLGKPVPLRREIPSSNLLTWRHHLS